MNDNSRKHIKVIGGVNLTEEKGEGANKRTVTVFVRKRDVVVEERHLGALFRRDWELCSMTIQIEPTNERLTPGYIFSDFTD